MQDLYQIIGEKLSDIIPCEWKKIIFMQKY